MKEKTADLANPSYPLDPRFFWFWDLDFDFRHHKRLAVLVPHHRIRLLIIHEALLLWIEFQRRPQREQVLGQVHFVSRQMFLHALEAFGGEAVTLDLLHDGV